MGVSLKKMYEKEKKLLVEYRKLTCTAKAENI